MNKNDIHFILDPDKYRHDVCCGQDNFYSSNFIYNFEFNIKINNIPEPINSLILYKNGKPYNNVQIFENGFGEYAIKDNAIIRRGNYNYGIELILNSGKIFSRNFNLKITNNYAKSDVKVNSFSTYGLHENYNALKIILNVETKQHIDNVKLYVRNRPQMPLNNVNVNNTDIICEQPNIIKGSFKLPIYWRYLGEMETEKHQYVYEDLIFEVGLDKPITKLYKAVITTSNGIVTEKTINAMIKPNTMSLNLISYAHTDRAEYDIFGGLMGRIDNKLSSYNEDIFQLIIQSTRDNKLLRINFPHYDRQTMYNTRYSFQATDFSVKYLQRIFNKVQTNKSPNSFTFTGKGVIHQKVSDNKTLYDTCRFELTLICGDDTFCLFDITADNLPNLSVKTEKTINNIIKYRSNGITKYLDATYIDKKVSNHMTNGFLYCKPQHADILPKLFFYNHSLKINDAVEITKDALPHFMKAAHILYNQENVFFFNYDTDGIYITRYDGINFITMQYKTYLTDNTIRWLNRHPNICFDQHDNIRMKFINSDGKNTFDKITLENNELNVIDCSEIILLVYNNIKQKIQQYIMNLNSVEYNGQKFFIQYNPSYVITEQHFVSMQFDNFVLNESMQKFVYSIDMDCNAMYINPQTNSETHFSADLKLTCTAFVNILNNDFTIQNHVFDYTITNPTMLINYQYHDAVEMPLPINIMEQMNGQYYIKFEKSKHATCENDYGNYQKCKLYNKSINLYELTLEDVYGKELAKQKQFFKYSDLYLSRLIHITDSIVYLIVPIELHKWHISILNLEKLKNIGEFTITSKMLFTKIISVALDKKPLTFQSIFSKLYQYQTTERTMHILTVSDKKQVSIYGLAQKPVPMNKIVDIGNAINEKENGFKKSYQCAFPLNIKNRATYLQAIDIH